MDASTDFASVKAKYEEERLKRLRSDGIRQFVEVSGEFAHFADDPYVQPGFQRASLHDEVDVLIIGGGLGGLVAGARLREAGFKRIRVVEEGGNFGGTWYWNRYPGCMCDVESYVYLPLLEELGYIPTRRYASSSEIRGYAQAIARKYGLYEDACLQTRVTGMQWDDIRCRWRVTTNRGDEISAHYVVIANGPLSKAKLPGIDGLSSFEGHAFHTSRWDYRYTGGDESGGMMTELGDKRVGIIGTGATAIQCIPGLGESAKELYVFQRTPSAVDVRNNAKTDPEWVRSLKPGWQTERIENFTAAVNGTDVEVDLVSDGWTDLNRRLTQSAITRMEAKLGRKLGREERAALLEQADFEVMEQIRTRVDSIVTDPIKAAALKPWYKRWCKRPTFHDEYLQTFNRPNVALVDTDGRGVDRVTPAGVIVAGQEYELDCLIFATGFEVGTGYSDRAGYDVIGRNGLSLKKKWANGFRTFHGLHSRDFPNAFFLGATQTGTNVNFTHALTEQAKHLAYILKEAEKRGASVVEATHEAEEAWVAEMERTQRAGTDYYKECTPSYLTNEGNLEEVKRLGVLASSYGPGSMKFYEMWTAWRFDGNLRGLELTQPAKAAD